MATKSITGKTRWGNPVWPLRGALGLSPCNGGGLQALFFWRWGCWHGGPYKAASEQVFKRATGLEILSAGGLYVLLMWCVEPGARLFAVIRPSTSPLSQAIAPRVAALGIVRRVESRPDGGMARGVPSRGTGFSDQVRWAGRAVGIRLPGRRATTR
jgi:hypothetical protein